MGKQDFFLILMTINSTCNNLLLLVDEKTQEHQVFL